MKLGMRCPQCEGELVPVTLGKWQEVFTGSGKLKCRDCKTQFYESAALKKQKWLAVVIGGLVSLIASLAFKLLAAEIALLISIVCLFPLIFMVFVFLPRLSKSLEPVEETDSNVGQATSTVIETAEKPRQTRWRFVVLLCLILGGAAWYLSYQGERQYSGKRFWQTAELADVEKIPPELLAVGNQYGPVLLFAAGFSDDERIVQALIDKGADVNEVDAVFTGTALSSAVIFTNNMQVIRVLVENGGDLNVTVGCGENLLVRVVRMRSGDEAKTVLDTLFNVGLSPSKISQQDCKGRDAITWAEREGKTDLVRYLQQKQGK